MHIENTNKCILSRIKLHQVFSFVNLKHPSICNVKPPPGKNQFFVCTWRHYGVARSDSLSQKHHSICYAKVPRAGHGVKTNFLSAHLPVLMLVGILYYIA